MGAMGLASSVVVETSNNRFQFEEDVRFSWDWLSRRLSRLERYASLGLLLKSFIAEADIVHIHAAGRIAFGAQRWARTWGKPTVRHFHGEELRAGGAWREAVDADAILVSTPDLLPLLRAKIPDTEATWMPVPRSFPQSFPTPRKTEPGGRMVRVVHAYIKGASYAQTYGTQPLRATVERLRGRSLPVELDEVCGVTYPQALARYARADIAVDKLNIGWYGAFSVECLARGLPSLAGVDTDLIKFDPPVIPVTLSNLEDELAALVSDEDHRHEVAERLFLRGIQLHDSHVVAKAVSRTYATLLG